MDGDVQAQNHYQRKNQGPNSQRIITQFGFLHWGPFVSKDEAMSTVDPYQSVVWQWC